MENILHEIFLTSEIIVMNGNDVGRLWFEGDADDKIKKIRIFWGYGKRRERPCHDLTQ